MPGIEAAEISAAREFAAQVNYPILVKAAAGGGGRGMRVSNAAQLEGALEAAAREAAAAFGDGRIFIEQYLAHPRHIEIQILGDEHGQSSHSASVIARSSGGIRKLSKSRPRRTFHRHAREDDRRGAETRARRSLHQRRHR